MLFMLDLTEVKAQEFRGKVLEKTGPIVVVYWMDDCVHCEAFRSTLQALVDEFSGKAEFVLFRVTASDEDREVAMRSRVQVAPTLKVFYRGTIIGDVVGSLSQDRAEDLLKRFIENKDECIANSSTI